MNKTFFSDGLSTIETNTHIESGVIEYSIRTPYSITQKRLEKIAEKTGISIRNPDKSNSREKSIVTNIGIAKSQYSEVANFLQISKIYRGRSPPKEDAIKELMDTCIDLFTKCDLLQYQQYFRRVSQYFQKETKDYRNVIRLPIGFGYNLTISEKREGNEESDT